MRKVLILFALLLVHPVVGQTETYKTDFYYPDGDGPFPVIILSHGRGGPNVSYHDMAALMVKQAYAAIVLDHYSVRGDYGTRFLNFPKIDEGKDWREEDLSLIHI